MKLVRVVVVFSLLGPVLAGVSNINLGPTGNYARLSTKGGLYASITLLLYVVFSEFGFLPFEFIGRKKRSTVNQLMIDDFTERNSVLKVIRALDHKDCLLRFLCELEAHRSDAEKNNCTLDPDLESHLILLKVAKRNKHPALLMREDPGSPALPFETAVFTGTEGLDSCVRVFNTCPYNITTMQSFLAEDFDNSNF